MHFSWFCICLYDKYCRQRLQYHTAENGVGNMYITYMYFNFTKDTVLVFLSIIV